MNECCKDPNNRKVESADFDRSVEQCTKCGRRHYSVSVDPIPLGVTMAGK